MKRHRWVILAGLAVSPVVTWLVAVELWWAYSRAAKTVGGESHPTPGRGTIETARKPLATTPEPDRQSRFDREDG